MADKIKSKAMLEINLMTAIIDVFKFGQMDGENRNVDLFVFSHPLYFDRVVGYEKAFVCFEFNNN